MRDYEQYVRELSSQLKGTTIVGGGVIKEIGQPIHPELNLPQMVPIELTDGTFAVLGLAQWKGRLLVNRSDEMGLALRHSIKMPEVGVGSKYYYITAFPRRPDGKKAVIKIGYNFEAGEDSIRYE